MVVQAEIYHQSEFQKLLLWVRS